MPTPSQRGNSECSHIRSVLDRVGDRWGLLVISRLLDHPKRFNELQQELEGISHRMLTLTLRLLEREGIVARSALPTKPPGVAYGLTPVGESLIEPVRALSQWARDHGETIRAARQRFDGAVLAKAERPAHRGLALMQTFDASTDFREE